jgi:CheY-like chemotaxis protein
MQANLERLRILVVDDNLHMINIVKTILHGFGVRHVLDARDAAEAFKHLREGFVDLVIVDYQMELLDGVEFVRLVRSGKDVPDPLLPIIMLTAHSERTHVLAARDAGVTEFCRKPITAGDLWAKIAECISRPRAFVRGSGFVGPDRRRHAASHSGDERRGQEDEESPDDTRTAS